MNTRVWVATLAWASSVAVSGQNGFLISFDDVQEGRNGVGVSVKETESGYLIFARQFSETFPAQTHVYVRKVDSSGAYEHEHEFLVGDNRDFDLGYIDPVTQRPGGSFAVVVTEGYDYAGSKFLYVISDNGDTISRHFVTTYPPQDSIIHVIRQTRSTASNGYVLVGAFDPPNELSSILLVRLNDLGDTLWTNHFGTSAEAPVGLGVAQYLDGGFLLTGYGTPPGNQNMSFLIRVDIMGNFLWRRNYGGRASVNGAVRITADGGIITWSEYRDGTWPTDWQQMMLTRWDENGAIIWQKKSHYNYFTNSFIATGTSLLNGVLAKFTPEGDSLWSRNYAMVQGGSNLFDVEPTSDGGFVATGTAFATSLDTGYQTNQLIWVLKTDSLGCVVPGCQNVGVQAYEIGLQEQLVLSPNPASDRLTINLPLPTGFALEGQVQAVLLDAQGRTVLERSMAARSGAITDGLDVSELPAGVYYVHLRDARRWLAGGTVVVE